MIRPATEADVPDIVAMGLAFLRESSYHATFAENAEQMAATARRLIASADGDLLLLERRGIVLGMLGLIAYDHFISAQRVAGEVVFWVDATARGNGVALLRAAERWAVAHGAVSMQMISPSARVDALYQRLGYAPIERTFQRAL